MSKSLFDRCFSGDYRSDTCHPQLALPDQLSAKLKLEPKWRTLEATSSSASLPIGTGVFTSSRPDSRASDLSTGSCDSSDDLRSFDQTSDSGSCVASHTKSRKGLDQLRQLLKRKLPQQHDFHAPQQLPQELPPPTQAEPRTQPPPSPAALAATNEADALHAYALQHGRRIMSISTLQQGLQHFIMPGVGYMAYTIMYNGPAVLNIKSAVALSDPVCAVDQYGVMAEAFLQQHPGAIFVQISKDFATVLSALGLKVNSLAGETHLDLQKYTFSGYAKRGLRSAISSAVKEGYTVQEVMQAAQDGNPAGCKTPGWSDLAAEMQEVDKSWVNAKGQHAADVWFLNRPPVLAPENGVRKFTARDAGGRLAAFIFFDAVYEGGNVVGYYANVTRMRPEAHPGVLNLLIKEFLDRIRAECQLSAPAKKLSIKKSKLKKQQAAATASDTVPVTDTTSVVTTSSTSSVVPTFLSLGMSPFHARDDSEFDHSRILSAVLGVMYRQGSGFYPAKTVAAAKAKYGAGLHDGRYEDPNVTYEQVYLAHSLPDSLLLSIVPAQKMFDLMKLIGIWDNHIEAIVRYYYYQAKRSARIVEKRVTKVIRKQHKTRTGGSVPAK